MDVEIYSFEKEKKTNIIVLLGNEEENFWEEIGAIVDTGYKHTIVGEL